MAPTDSKDENFSLRRFRGASGTPGRTLPEWTAGDDSEDEEVMTVQRRQKARRLRSRGRPRQEKRQITPPPPDDSSDDSGIDSGIDNGIDSGDESGDEIDQPPIDQPPIDQPPARPTVAPSRTSRSVESTSLISSTTSTATAAPGPPPLGDIDSPPFLIKPALPEPTDADSADSDSDDETSTFAPTATGTRSSSGTDRLPTQTASEPLPATNTASSANPEATIDAATAAKQQHHRNVETALTVVGSVAGAVCIGVIIWALIRFFKRRRRDDSPGSSPSMPKPSRRMRFLAHVPILNTRFANRSWFNIDDPYVDDGKDHRAFAGDDDLLGYLPEKPPAVAAANAPQLRLINVDDTGYYTTSTMQAGDTGYYTTSTMQAGDTNQAIASQNQPLYSPTASTLSSAFGNGTFMAPNEPHPPPAARHPEEDHLRPPAYRDTVYTESSEVSSVPRFRTVNSWVRHQTSRVRQSSPPPMPDYRYVETGDEEELKRVVVAPQGVGYAQ